MRLTPADRVTAYSERGWWGREIVDDLLLAQARRRPDQDALCDPPNREALDGRPPRRLTWRALADEVGRMAGALRAFGLRKDDIVCVQAPNTVETVVLALACARAGFILSPAALQYRRHELDYILDAVRPSAFVTVDAFAGHRHAAHAAELIRDDRSFKVLTFGPSDAPGAEDLLARAPACPAVTPDDPDRPAADEVFTICWTSGTEARPKGVPRDHNHWIVNSISVTEAGDVRDGERILNPFPLINIAAFGVTMCWLRTGGLMALHHPFDLQVFLTQIAQEQINYTIAPPAVLNMLLKNEALLEGADLSSLRAIGSGSAPLSPWMIEGFKTRLGIDVGNIFGSNEGTSLFSGPAHVPSPADRARYFPRFGAEGVEWSGRTPTMMRTRLVDPDTEEEITGPGRPGELRIDGASVISGYYKAPDINARAFDDRGWFRTGDLFEIAGDGDLARFYRFVGRCKDIIVRGGVNISPAEIDDLLAGWPAVREAAVVGVPDEVLGERMCVAVVPAGNAPSLEDVKQRLLGAGLAVFKLPERLVTLDALPRNALAKVVRGELRTKVLDALARSPV